VTEAAWKRTERAVAARLGGQRIPITGRVRGDAPDVAHPLWSVEVKHRRALPAWLLTAMAQAEAAARGEQVPLVVLHERGQRYERALAVLRLGDLTDLVGPIGEEGDDAR